MRLLAALIVCAFPMALLLRGARGDSIRVREGTPLPFRPPGVAATTPMAPAPASTSPHPGSAPSSISSTSPPNPSRYKLGRTSQEGRSEDASESYMACENVRLARPARRPRELLGHLIFLIGTKKEGALVTL
ncbi:hypothetical protein BDY17DRAFT_54897 [Neohortaea acidophila]|uniref:Uncharacterized protein n=1 Tax=Neohortaea acidophila TaxID=245834 RepID=A0A6A6PF27_9PEZI|nr:uncharacterized protein BDY17DRAFT_54897 [Neohortaea acidophila]KAF2478589.1 hypothetical protein BDY17DRAFT_54897 [Neohortaea acidophila]